MVIFGPKTIAVFDIWSLEHFVAGINLFSFLIFMHGWRRPGIKPDTVLLFGWLMAYAFAWEALEHYLELGLAGDRVAYWFQGVEFYLNRLVADPLTIVIGALVAMRFRFLRFPAKVFSIVWIAVHIFVFPDSMYLQRFLPIISV